MNWKSLFLFLAIIFLALGLGVTFFDHNKGSTMAIVEGGAKGLAGVFFILYYIFLLIGNQPTDKTTH